MLWQILHFSHNFLLSCFILKRLFLFLDEEKKLVEDVFNNAIDSLSDEDKTLPQVEHVLPLLKKGIGIHHSGLLPLLKETIEILFHEGLIKVQLVVLIRNA